MNPFGFILLLVGGAVIWSLTKTAKAAVNLNYNVLRFGIYKFASDGNLILRLRMRFTNAQNTPLHINMIDLAAYVKSQTSTDAKGNLKVISRGTMLASYTNVQGFIIAPNNYTDQDFLINVRWADVGRYLLTNVYSIITTILNANQVSEYIAAIVGTNILVSGIVKAEGISFPVNELIQLTDDRQNA